MWRVLQGQYSVLTPAWSFSKEFPRSSSLSKTHTKPSCSSSSLTTANPSPEQPPVTLQISRRSDRCTLGSQNNILVWTHKNMRPVISILWVVDTYFMTRVYEGTCPGKLVVSVDGWSGMPERQPGMAVSIWPIIPGGRMALLVANITDQKLILDFCHWQTQSQKLHPWVLSFVIIYVWVFLRSF